MEDGRTNVVGSTRLSLVCGYLVHRLSWLDGMPVVFNYPVVENIREAFPKYFLIWQLSALSFYDLVES